MTANENAQMPDLFELIARGWKKILLVVVIALAMVTVILFFTPKEYRAVTTALPGSPYAIDKGSVFNAGIQVLYPSLGTTDDLDKVVGTAQLDTLYKSLVDSFHLTEVYGTDNKKNSRQLAVEILKGCTRVTKSDFGELKIKVWQTDPGRAADLANAAMQQLQRMHQQVQNADNMLLLQKLKEAKSKKESELKLTSAVKSSDDTVSLPSKVLQQQIQEYEKLIGEYELMLQANPEVLKVVEYATAPVKYDRPLMLPWLAATAVASFLFALLALLVTERKRHTTR